MSLRQSLGTGKVGYHTNTTQPQETAAAAAAAAPAAAADQIHDLHDQLEVLKQCTTDKSVFTHCN